MNQQTVSIQDLRIRTPEGLNTLHAELNRQRNTKRDYIASGSSVKIVPLKDDIEMTLDGIGSFSITDNAHNQISGKLSIPKAYYDRMKEYSPDLLAYNCNHWLSSEQKPRLVRTLDGKARAFLSDRYKVIDNDDIFALSIREMQDNNLTFHKADLTENHMYIKAVSTTTQAEIRKGDVVQAGIVIRNSETGLSSFAVEPFMLRLVCTNGLIMPDAGMSKAHLGRINNEGNYSRETQELNALASLSEMRDIIRNQLNGGSFDKTVALLTAATETPIDKPLLDVTNISSHLGFTDSENEAVLASFIKQSDPTKYGLMNAITATAQDIANSERSIHLETQASQVITLEDETFDDIISRKLKKGKMSANMSLVAEI